LKKLINSANKNNLALLTINKDNPSGYGRILRKNKNTIDGIVEEKDANASQREIREVNSGIMAIKSNSLAKLIPMVKNKNVAKEFLLTDIVELANNNKIKVKALLLKDSSEVLGANNPQELHDLERAYQRSLAENLIRSGVKVADSSRLDVRGAIEVGRDSFIDVNSVFEGINRIGRRVSIGPGCFISNSIINNDVVIHANSVIEDSVVGRECEIGPFARIRGGTEMESGSELGNFVEANRSKIGKSSKAKHLTYLGDATLGNKVNVGAGTITCNYDGEKKYKTVAEDGVFIGSNTSLVAPVKLGKGSYTGAGSVITKNVGNGELAVGRGKQVNLKRKKK
jgi:bifunctional UDP-N-acetylglucosamine pyrophosphorylase/glucosamine-1-phosphate N-acetyltransferase